MGNATGGRSQIAANDLRLIIGSKVEKLLIILVINFAILSQGLDRPGTYEFVGVIKSHSLSNWI